MMARERLQTPEIINKKPVEIRISKEDVVEIKETAPGVFEILKIFYAPEGEEPKLMVDVDDQDDNHDFAFDEWEEHFDNLDHSSDASCLGGDLSTWLKSKDGLVELSTSECNAPNLASLKKALERVELFTFDMDDI